MRVPAIVAAGDRKASRAIRGESKLYLEIGGRPLVEHVVDVLECVPEVSEIWVVGNAERLERVFGDEAARARRPRPLRLVDQFRNLYENGWETYRRLLPGAPPEGRDPTPEDGPALFLSADLPFATPHEISVFVRRSVELDVDHTVGLVTEASLRAFYPEAPGKGGIHMAYFNLREGRFRQSNLHLIRPGRVKNRYYVEEMYEHRYQKEFREIAALAWRLLRSEKGGFAVVGYYGLMHLAGWLDRHSLQGPADVVRSWIRIERIEQGISSLLGGEFRFVVTEGGGCAVDIDNAHDYDVAAQRYEEWRKEQLARVEQLYGPLPLPERAGDEAGAGPDAEAR